MSAEEKPSQPQENAGAGKGEGKQESTFTSILLPVLTVIGTGIGAIGFVIFFGGFIVWTRFDAAGLPANEAVAQVPRNELVVTGASFLVPALLGALLAAAVVVALWDAVIGNRRRRREAAARAETIRSESELRRLEAQRQRLAREIEKLRHEMKRQGKAAEEAEVNSPERARARGRADQAEASAGELEERLEKLEGEIPKAEDGLAKLIESEPQAKRSTGRERLLQVAIGGIPMLTAEAIVIAFGWSGLTLGYQGLLVLVVVATISVAIVVISMTDHFAWFTLCVFVGVGITIAVSNYARTQSHTKISPVAALTGSAPVTGFYVAETKDALYVGVPELRGKGGDADFDHDAATLVRVPKSDVSGLTVGPLMDELPAYRRSLELALALCRHAKAAAAVNATQGSKLAQGKAKQASAPPGGCDRGYVRRLRRRLVAVA